MKKRGLYIVIISSVLIFPFVILGQDVTVKDKSYSQLLIGTWQYSENNEVYETTFKKYGAWSGKGIDTSTADNNKITVSGTWYVFEGNIYEKVVTSSASWLEGNKSVNIIISIGPNFYIYQNESGETKTATRK